MSKFVDTQSVSIGVSIAANGGSEPSLFARGPAAYKQIGAVTEEVPRENHPPDGREAARMSLGFLSLARPPFSNSKVTL